MSDNHAICIGGPCDGRRIRDEYDGSFEQYDETDSAYRKAYYVRIKGSRFPAKFQFQYLHDIIKQAGAA